MDDSTSILNLEKKEKKEKKRESSYSMGSTFKYLEEDS